MYMYHARCHAVADGQTKRLRRDEGLQVSHTNKSINRAGRATGGASAAWLWPASPAWHIASIGTVTGRSRFTRSYVATGSRDLLFSYLERIPTFILNRYT